MHGVVNSLAYDAQIARYEQLRVQVDNKVNDSAAEHRNSGARDLTGDTGSHAAIVELGKQVQLMRSVKTLREEVAKETLELKAQQKDDHNAFTTLESRVDENTARTADLVRT
ncbi:hypothetical protein LTR95_005475 [Oleoguttula sp. CCFEE 5521]